MFILIHLPLVVLLFRLKQPMDWISVRTVSQLRSARNTSESPKMMREKRGRVIMTLRRRSSLIAHHSENPFLGNKPSKSATISLS